MNTNETNKPIHDNAVQRLFLRLLKAEKVYKDKKDERSKSALDMSVKLYEATKNNRDNQKGG